MTSFFRLVYKNQKQAISLEAQRTARSFLVWGIADIYFILSVTVAMLLGVLLPSIQKELGLTTTQLGLLGFAFFVTFGVMQFITGSLIDSRGSRAALTVSALIATGGFFLLSQVHTFAWAIIAQMIVGMGFSVTYVGAIYLAEMWFSEKQFPFLSGITQMSANIVSALVLFIMAVTGVILVDFRTIVTHLALISFTLAVLIFLFVRNAPSDSDRAPIKRSFFSADLSQLFRVPQFWFGVLYFSTNFGVFLAFSSLWNIPDSLAYGHSLKTATMMSATLRFGGAFGAVISGLLVNRLSRCSTLIKAYCTGALCLGAFLIFGPVFPNSVTFLIMGCTGFFFGGTALGFPLVAQHIPPSLKGAGFGLMTSIGYLLCAFLEYLVGVFLSYIHSSNLPVTIAEFKFALTPLVVVLVIGWLCSLKLQEAT